MEKDESGSEPYENLVDEEEEAIGTVPHKGRRSGDEGMQK